MAISASLLTKGGSSTNAASYNTASITPTGGKVVMVGAHSSITSGTPNDATVSGCGMTWTKVTSTVYDGNKKITLYWGVGSAPSEGALTIAFDSQTQLACNWVVVQLTNADASDPVVQSAIDNTISGDPSTVSATLSAFSDTSNATVGFAGNESGSSVSLNPGSGFSEIGETGFVDSLNAMFEFKNSNDTSVDAARTSDTGAMAIIGAEIRHIKEKGSVILI